MDEFPEDKFSTPPETTHPRLSIGAVVGAAFGLALGAILVRWGFWPALGALVFALAGGFLGRIYVGD